MTGFRGIRRLFVEVVGVAREMGVVRFGTLSVDGTKVRANASKRKALMARAGAVDAEGDERYGEEVQRREKRLAAIEEAKERLETAQRAADDARGRKPGQERNPKGGSRTSAPMESPTRRRRATSPTPRAGS